MTIDQTPTPTPDPNQSPWRTVAFLALIALIGFCIAWEIELAPITKGWLAIKVLPLLLAIKGISRGNVYTYQWSSMLALAYLCEGIVRGMSDPAPVRVYGWIEAALATTFFIACLAYAYPFKRLAKQRKQTSNSSTSDKT